MTYECPRCGHALWTKEEELFGHFYISMGCHRCDIQIDVDVDGIPEGADYVYFKLCKAEQE